MVFCWVRLRHKGPGLRFSKIYATYDVTETFQILDDKFEVIYLDLTRAIVTTIQRYLKPTYDESMSSGMMDAEPGGEGTQ